MRLPLLIALFLNAAGLSLDAAAAEPPLLDAAYVRDHSAPMDWTRLLGGSEPVVYIGETHEDSRVKTELGRRMQEIRSLGFTHLALEIWPDSDQKDFLDAYSNGAKTDDDLLARFKTLIRRNAGGAADPAQEDAVFVYYKAYYMNYINLMHAANAAGLWFIGPDMSVEEKTEMLRICDQTTPRPKQCSDNPKIHDRDWRMASNLSRVLRDNPGARILALVGSEHAGRANQPAVLAKYGWASKSYVFSDGDGCSDAVGRAGMTAESLFIDLSAAPLPLIDLGKPYGRQAYDGCISMPPLRPRP